MSMFKSVQVNYLKRRAKVADIKVTGIIEPKRVTMYDIVLENLRIAERRTFMHRTIYIGEHSFTKEEHMVNFFSETVSRANESIHIIEKLTGILIRYRRYFIHLIEGDEDVSFEQMRLLLHDRNNSSFLGTVKLLASINHINQRHTTNWICLNGVPPKLLEEIDPDAAMDVVGNFTYTCLQKLYEITQRIQNYNSLELTTVVDVVGGSEKSDVVQSMSKSDRSYRSSSSSEPTRLNSIRLGNRMHQEISGLSTSPLSNYAFGSRLGPTLSFSRLNFPEVEILEFLLYSKLTTSLQVFCDTYGNVPQRDIYKDKVWPIASDFIPYDIFSEEYNISSKFPKPNGDEAVPEEERADDFVLENEEPTSTYKFSKPEPEHIDFIVKTNE